MNFLFNFDNPVFRFLSRITDIILLNLLFLICCIPIITIGPSVTALYYCMLKIVRNHDSSITEMFFHSFRDNLKQGALLTLIFLACTLFLVFDILLCNIFELSLASFIKAFLYIFLFILIAMMSYAFPLLAQFENSIKNILKNSFIISILNIGYTIIIICLNSIPFLLLFCLTELFLISLPIWITCGISLICLINSTMFVKIFDKLISQEQS